MPRLAKGRIMMNTVVCNVCGRSLRMEKGILMEDAFEATKEWGYFSERDTEVHKFTICEPCYERMIEQFKIPIIVTKKTEVL